jgi:2-(1,2-epoxy-1,2-dihydrophenyl)acetyl-CoA isomerase
VSGGEEHVTVGREGAVAHVTLNRPDRLNALTDAMRARLAALFTELGQDDSVRVVILDAAGRGFCASGDVSNMGRFTAVSGRDRLRSAHRMIRAIADIEKPVIAAVRGPVAGIGWSMALACDIIVASETAVFSQVFRHVGLVPDGGAIYFLVRVLGVLRAKELVYTGRKMLASEAMQLGLVTRLVADDQLEAEAAELANSLASGPGFAFGVVKKMFRSMNVPSLEACLDAETWAQGITLMSEDHQEGVAAFKEKRKPRFDAR